MNAPYDGKRFYNLDRNAYVHKSFTDVLKWMFTRQKTPWPEWVEDGISPTLPTNIKPNETYITHINHATELLQFQNLNVITDPIFSRRVSPLSWLGPQRVRSPGISLPNLPKIDAILVSHNHYDHLDLSSLTALRDKDDPVIIVPLGNAKLLRSHKIFHVIELDWWQEYHFSETQKVTLVPAQHWSGRYMADAFRTLWGGYVLSSHQLNIYFAGDTGYQSHFSLIKNHFKTIHVSMLPIGSYSPRWFMQAQHIDAEEAIQAHFDLGSALSIGMHFGCFQLTDEGIDEPIEELKKALQSHHLPAEKFIIPKHGTTVYYHL